MATGQLIVSRTAAQRVLWGAGLILVPFPLLAFADAFVPTLRMLELALIILVAIVVEGAHGVAGLLFGLFFAHAVVYAGVLWLGTQLLTRALARWFPRALAPATGALVILSLVVAVAFPVYETPFHAHLPHANLLEVYR